MTSRGRPLSPSGEREEVHCELVATSYELIGHDLFELAAYASIAEGLNELGDLVASGEVDAALASLEACEARLTDVRRRDLGENSRHRSVLRIARGDEVVA